MKKEVSPHHEWSSLLPPDTFQIKKTISRYICQRTNWMTHYQPKSPRFWRCVMRYTVFKIAHVWEFPVQTLSDTLMRNLLFPLMPHSEPSQVSLKDHRDCLRELAGLQLEDAGLSGFQRYVRVSTLLSLSQPISCGGGGYTARCDTSEVRLIYSHIKGNIGIQFK